MTGAGDIMQSDPGAEAGQLSRLDAWRSARDDAAVKQALADLRAAASAGDNIMPASIAANTIGL